MQMTAGIIWASANVAALGLLVASVVHGEARLFAGGLVFAYIAWAMWAFNIVPH